MGVGVAAAASSFTKGVVGGGSATSASLERFRSVVATVEDASGAAGGKRKQNNIGVRYGG